MTQLPIFSFIFYSNDQKSIVLGQGAERFFETTPVESFFKQGIEINMIKRNFSKVENQ